MVGAIMQGSHFLMLPIMSSLREQLKDSLGNIAQDVALPAPR